MKRSPLARKTRIAPRSPKRADLYREARGPLVARLLSDRPTCQARTLSPPGVCSGVSEHIHERKTRARGGSLTDEANLLALCPGCHRHLHDNPAWAAQRGLLLHEWDEVMPWGL